MRQRSVATPVQVNSEAVPTTTFVILLAALLIMFATPHFVAVQLWAWSAVQLGDEPGAAITDGDIHPGDYGQISHTRYADGATCTYLITGALTLELCR